MFWGLILEPNKRYAQTVERPFHISQAAMDISTGDNEPCQVMVVVDGKNFLICTLQKNKTIQVPLDLYFKAGTSMAFLTNGKCNIHLTGYLDPEFDEELSGEEEEEEEEEAEAPALAQSKNKRKLENANDATASKKPKQDKKAAVAAAAAAAEESSDDEDDDDDEDQLQKFLDGQDISTDENDESFKMNTSQEASDSEDEEESDDDEEEEGDEDDTKNKSTDAETTLDTSKDSQVDMSKLSKSQKRRLKKKLQKQKEQPQMNGVDKAKKDKVSQKKEQPQKDKKEQKEKKKEAKKEQADKETVAKKEKKTLSGGVSIEDVKVGDGPVAKPGKTVLVYYEGRLKQNNKMFDNCAKGPGFKFRLGAKEVISGWDIGVNGMKVGGKRKIVCPPAMAYGAKGSPPVIPPNSTLVFEVELKDIK